MRPRVGLRRRSRTSRKCASVEVRGAAPLPVLARQRMRRNCTWFGGRASSGAASAPTPAAWQQQQDRKPRRREMPLITSPSIAPPWRDPSTLVVLNRGAGAAKRRGPTQIDSPSQRARQTSTEDEPPTPAQRPRQTGTQAGPQYRWQPTRASARSVLVAATAGRGQQAAGGGSGQKSGMRVRPLPRHFCETPTRSATGRDAQLTTKQAQAIQAE